MKILFIYPNRLADKTGGAAEANKLLKVLTSLASRDRNLLIDTLSLDDDKVDKTLTMDIMSRCLGHSSYFYFQWHKMRREVIELAYDIVYVSSSRLGFVVRDIHRWSPQTHVVVQWHNVEYDYAKKLFRGKHFIGDLWKNLEIGCVYRDERLSVRYGDYGLYMTEQDCHRSDVLYGPMQDHGRLPICRPPLLHPERRPKNDVISFVFIGALDYSGNSVGLKWFVHKVWSKYKDKHDMELIIAGSVKDFEAIRYLYEFINIKIYPNYDDIEAVIPLNAVFVSPVQSDVGMKTKVAEALALGLPIIGTWQTFVGYEEAMMDIRNQGILVEANTSGAFEENMNAWMKRGRSAKQNEEAVCLWQSYYSMERTEREVLAIMERVKAIQNNER